MPDILAPRADIVCPFGFIFLTKIAFDDIISFVFEKDEYLDKVISILCNNNIALPGIDKVSMSYFSESDGWGHCLDPKNISSMLK